MACVIPARYNSSRFPGKMLVKIFGKTVLERTFKAACEYFDQDQLYVATDDQRIAEHVEGFGGQVIWTAPECKNGTDRIAEAVAKTPALRQAEIIVNLQGDHPCTDRSTIRAAVEAMGPGVLMSTVATPIRTEADFHSPHVVKIVLDREGYALYASRAPIPYSKSGVPKIALQHIGLYCFRPDFLIEFAHLPTTPLQAQEDLEHLRAIEMGRRIKVAIVNEQAIGVDTPEDLAKVEAYLCQ